MTRDSMEIGTSNQELVGKNQKKLRIYIIGGVVLVIVIALIVTAAVLLTRENEEESGTTAALEVTTTTVIPPVGTTTSTEPGLNPIDLTDVTSGKLEANQFSGTWVSGTEIILPDADGNLILRNVVNNSDEILISATHPLLAESFDRELSKDRRYVKLAYNYEKVYRHSFKARYAAYDTQTQATVEIVPPSLLEAPLELCVWGPEGNSLSFVYGNNVYYKSTVQDVAVPISTNGVEGAVYNGVPDWVYEEEVFSSNRALWFSPNGGHLAYGTFDDRATSIMSLPYYGLPGQVSSQYTHHLNIHYPKPGTTNPTAGVVLVNLNNAASPTSSVLAPPSDLTEPILTQVVFVNDMQAAVVWMNRIQNTLQVRLCSDGDTACTLIYSYEQANGWVDMNPFIFNTAGTEFLTILPQVVGESSWKQIVKVTQATTGLWTLSPVTSTQNTVTQILKWEETRNNIWYQATAVDDSAAQHVYQLSMDTDTITCFTCNVLHTSGTPCLYNEAVFSEDAENLALSCLGPSVPEIYIMNRAGERLSVWEDNSELKEIVNNHLMPTISYHSVPVASNLPPAKVLLMTPQNASSYIGEMPLLVSVYGGPDSFQVTHKFSLSWSATLVTRWNIAVALIDGRGSGLMGVDNLFSIYRQLGTVEIDDQIAVTRYLQENFSYLNRNKSCIWGWSYGGYASVLALTRGEDTFSCAISVAPVTDWIYYDTIYTERYMGLPTAADNAEGYTQASVNSDATVAGLANKKYMLVHGTVDDNVHFQQSMMLAKILQHRDVYFTQMSYSDEDHSLARVRPHLYHALEKFLGDSFL